MKPTFLLLLSPAVLLIPLATPTDARKPEPSRLYRTLTGTSEKAKLRELTQLANRPKQRDAALDDLTAAGLEIAAQAAEQDAKNLPESTLQLLDLLGSSHQSQALDTLVNLLRSDHTKIAMASAEALGRYQRNSAIVALRNQIKRPDYATSYAFRFSLLKSIAELRSPEAVQFLSVTLPTLEGQLQHQVITFLEKVDKSYFRGDQARFDDWKTNTWRPILDSTFSAAEPGTAESYRAERYAKATYYGMPIYAKRLVFVIDRSPSMDELVDGQSRHRRAVLELSQAIEALDPATEFSVVVFSGQTRTWNNQLQEATPVNKRKAIKFAQQYYRMNLTNHYSALRKAFSIDDNLEAIYLISDGEPTTGKITEPREIIYDVTRRNTFRYIAINTVGIALTGAARDFMEQLARAQRRRISRYRVKSAPVAISLASCTSFLLLLCSYRVALIESDANSYVILRLLIHPDSQLSIDYATWRTTPILCENLRLCLQYDCLLALLGTQFFARQAKTDRFDSLLDLTLGAEQSAYLQGQSK